MQGEVSQVVFGEKQVEHVRCNHDGGGNGNAHPGKAARDAARAQEMADEGQAAGFAAERARNRFAEKLESAGLNVSGAKSPIRTSFCSRR